MVEDKEGFAYPTIDQSLCIQCGECIKSCPWFHHQPVKQPLKELVVHHKNDNVRSLSASGGAFSAFAEVLFQRKGVVFGARFDDDWGIVMDYTESAGRLDLFRRSKYVEAQVGDSYSQAETFLKQGREVLYVSTPCLIAGLKNYLVKDYENLYTVELGCWGVPPRKAWMKYLRENTVPPIYEISFRSKLLPHRETGVLIHDAKGMHLFKGDENCYKKAYVDRLMMRPSCAQCCYKHGASGADIAICDFWHIGMTVPTLNDNKGTSFIAIYSEKGKRIIPYYLFRNYVLTTPPSYTYYNRGLYGNLDSHPNCRKFLSSMDGDRCFADLVEYYLPISLWQRILRKVNYIRRKYRNKKMGYDSY
jgi:coenzyme F420-reducing hydrogenase beta subunit